MVQFLIKRLIGLAFVIICVTFITFILGYLAPGDPIRQQMGDHFDFHTWQQLRHIYGLDLPWYRQYYNFLTHLVKLDFGLSFKYQNRAVWDILKDGVPISTELGVWGLLIELLIGIPVGIYSALKANTWIDTTSMGVSLIIYALPPFVIAIIAQVAIVALDKASGGSWPASSWGVPWQYDWTDLQPKIVPILVYAAAGFAYFSRITRTTMLEVLRQDYVRTARAKGLRERVVIYRHALRNALIPLVTLVGLALAFLVGGNFFIEAIFNIPGIGQLSLQSIYDHDYPVIQATVVLLAIGVVLGNLLSDILYTIVDPRIKNE
jgi:ABC-type dipeptide/oligopeptide/nickel transport system permease component